MSDITREQFRDAVTAAMQTVRHLHRELAKLYEALRDALEAEPATLRELVSPAGLRARVHGEAKRPGLGETYTALFREAGEDDETADEDEVVREEEDDDERGSKMITLRPDEPLVALRIMLLDPESAEGFEPQILFALVDTWRVEGKPSTRDPEPIELRRYMARRIPNVLRPELPAAQRGSLPTSASAAGRRKGERRVSCRLATPVESAALYELEGPEAVDRLAARVRAVWQQRAHINEKGSGQGV